MAAEFRIAATAGRGFVIALLACLVGTGPARAADAGSGTTPPGADKSCIEVETAGSVYGRLNCLNADLSAQAAAESAKANRNPALAVPGAAAPPTELGLYSLSATQERLGSGFGHGVTPQRPVENYPGPLGK